jgi:Ribbon-helix-helix protein, copG family
MQRTTIVAPEQVLQRLRRMAAERGTSMADLIREALEAKVGTDQPRPRSLGLGASGHTDTAQRAGNERPLPRSWR